MKNLKKPAAAAGKDGALEEHEESPRPAVQGIFLRFFQASMVGAGGPDLAWRLAG